MIIKQFKRNLYACLKCATKWTPAVYYAGMGIGIEMQTHVSRIKTLFICFRGVHRSL